MKFRMCALLALVVCVPLSSAADEKAKSPTLLLRVKGVDDLVSDVRFIAEQAGRDEEMKQFERLLKREAKDKGFEGFDTKKPLAMYGFLGAQGIDSEVVVMIPIADQKVFLAAVRRLIDIGPEKKGVYEVQPPGSPFPAYFRFVNGYLYGTIREADAIADAKILKPEKVFAGHQDMVSLSLDLNDVPKELSNLVVGLAKLSAGELKKKKEGETQAMADYRAAAVKDGIALFESLLTESGTLTARLGVDRKAGELALSVQLAGQKGTSLAKSIAELGKTRSTVSGIIGKDSASSSRLTLELPEATRKSLAALIDEGIDKMLTDIPEQAARDIVEPVVKSFVPTLKQARLDTVLDVRGPSEKKTYVIVGAAGVKDGAKIEKEIKAALKKLPAEMTEAITLDAAKLGDVNIHKVKISHGLDAEAQKQLGDDVLYFALRDDALFVAMGDGSLSAIKDAVKSKATTGSLMHVEFSVSRLAQLAAATQKGATKAAEEAFKEKGSDKVIISLEGGETLRLKLSVKGAVLRFFALMDAAGKE